MNIVLWILQVFLSVHTFGGAVWKVSNPSQSVPFLSAIPQAAWVALIALEMIASVCLILPAFGARFRWLSPLAAAFIALEMLLFIAIHQASGSTEMVPVKYWLVVAVVCTGLAWARKVRWPHSGASK